MDPMEVVLEVPQNISDYTNSYLRQQREYINSLTEEQITDLCQNPQLDNIRFMRFLLSVITTDNIDIFNRIAQHISLAKLGKVIFSDKYIGDIVDDEHLHFCCNLARGISFPNISRQIIRYIQPTQIFFSYIFDNNDFELFDMVFQRKPPMITQRIMGSAIQSICPYKYVKYLIDNRYDVSYELNNMSFNVYKINDVEYFKQVVILMHTSGIKFGHKYKFAIMKWGLNQFGDTLDILRWLKNNEYYWSNDFDSIYFHSRLTLEFAHTELGKKFTSHTYSQAFSYLTAHIDGISIRWLDIVRYLLSNNIRPSVKLLRFYAHILDNSPREGEMQGHVTERLEQLFQEYI